VLTDSVIPIGQLRWPRGDDHEYKEILIDIINNLLNKNICIDIIKNLLNKNICISLKESIDILFSKTCLQRFL
jgi:hypothetical protein